MAPSLHDSEATNDGREPDALSDPTADAVAHEHRPFSHGLRDVAIANARAFYVKAMVGGVFLTAIVVLSVLSIYWGAFWRIPSNTHNLHIVIVDLDGGAIGQTFGQGMLAPSFTGAAEQLTYELAPTGQFASEEEVQHYVVDEHVWGAVVIAQGATQRLSAAVASANASYDGHSAITAYVVSARNENVVPILLQPQLVGALDVLSAAFAVEQAKQLGASGANLATLLSTAPAIVTQPVSYTVQDLRPFDVPVAAAVDFVGLIYLLIISFLLALLNYNARAAARLDTLLRLPQLIALRLGVPFISYFVLSWIYSFISLAFQVPFSRYHGHGGFVIYWALSYLGMCALGLAIESLVTILTPRFIPFFLILWIISNVSCAYYPIEVLPGVFKYGYAAPFYNVGSAVRTLLFGTKSHLGLNFGVLIAWIAVSTVTLTIFTTFTWRRNRSAEEQRKRDSKIQ